MNNLYVLINHIDLHQFVYIETNQQLTPKYKPSDRGASDMLFKILLHSSFLYTRR